MSLAAALKKGQSAIDSLGSWDPFQEPGGNGAVPARLPVARTARSQERSSQQRPAQDRSAQERPDQGRSAQDRSAVPANLNAASSRPAVRSQSQRPQSQLRAVPDMDELADFDPPATRPVPSRSPAQAAKGAAPRNAAPQGAGQRPRGKASWLHENTPHRGRVNAAQYIRELERYAAEESRRAVADTVMDVNPGEIEGVAKLAARIKGRYLAKLLDLGNPSKSTVQDTEVRELTRYRETYEELARGLDMLKAAIEAGDVGVSGMVRR